MKLTKLEFKEMLKDAIVELVKEGRLNPVQLVDTSAIPSPGGINNRGFAAQQEMVDPANRMGLTPNTRLNEAVKNTAIMVSKGDPKQSKLYETIFMDTAKTTLQKKLAAELGQAGGGTDLPATPEEREFDKAALNAFEGKDNWAMLAFGRKTQ